MLNLNVKGYYPVTVNFETDEERDMFDNFMKSKEFQNAYKNFLKRVAKMKEPVKKL